jgi:hypothetical protein
MNRLRTFFDGMLFGATVLAVGAVCNAILKIAGL